MEYCATDLEKILETDAAQDKQKRLPLLARLKLAKDAALGMDWLHGILSIVHGDLKPQNLMVQTNVEAKKNPYTVKVGDFGFSVVKAADDLRRENVGSPLVSSN